MKDHVVTIRDAISQFKHWVVTPDGKLSDDHPFSNRAIADHLLQTRSSVLQAAMDSGMRLSKENEQVLDCVSLQKVDQAECPCLPPSGCVWLRTIEPIPSDILIRAVTGVVTSGDNPRFEYIEWDQFQYIPTARMKSVREGKYYTLRDTGEGLHMYLYEQNLEAISISGVWYNPMEAAAYPRCGTRDQQAVCNPLDVKFHTDSKFISRIIQSQPTDTEAAVSLRRAAVPDLINEDMVGNNPAGSQAGN